MRRRAILFFLIFSVVGVVSAEQNSIGFPKLDERGNPTESFASRGIQLTVESSRSRYGKQEDIWLDLHISNNGYYPVTFYLNKNYLKNFTIVVRDQNGKSLPVRDIAYFKTHDDYNDPFFSTYTATNFEARSITLQPGESMVRPIRLQDVIQMQGMEQQNKKKLQKLLVNAYFYPNPEQSPDLFLPSNNSFTFLIEQEKQNLPQENDSYFTSLASQRLQVSPLETVFLTLSAEKTETWKNFFKYISLKDLIRDYPDFARSYMQSKNAQKNSVLKSFQEFLMDKDRHELLKFKVLSEQKNKQTATVKVQARRRIQGFDREFFYTYYLTRADEFWLITGVESRLIK